METFSSSAIAIAGAGAGAFLFLYSSIAGDDSVHGFAVFGLTTFICKMTSLSTIEAFKLHFVKGHCVYIHWLSLIIISGR